MARRLASFAAALGAAALAAAACGRSYGESEAAAPDAAVAPDEAGPTADPCSHLGPPAAPAVEDAPGVELPPFFVAIKALSLENGDRIGFDLDGTCTCDDRPGSAHDGGASCQAAQPTCDIDGGVDNSLGVLANAVAPFFPLDSLWSDLIKYGQRTMLVQIAGYNGQANDKEISVGMMISSGIHKQGCPTSTYDSQVDAWSPGWCGDDAWSVMADTVIPGNGTTFAPLSVGQGYVRDGVLVARFKGTTKMLFSAAQPVTFADSIVVAKIVPLGEDLAPRDPSRPPTDREKRLFRLDQGLFAGRVTAKSLLTAIGTVEQRLLDGGLVSLCETPGFAGMRGLVCGGLDLPQTKALDFDPTAACDSLSAAAPFAAEPALAAGVSTSGPDKTRCDPGPDGEPIDAGTAKYSCD